MLDHGSDVLLALPPRSLKNQRNSEPWEGTVAAGVSEAEACTTPHGLSKIVEESRFAKVRHYPLSRIIRARDEAKCGSGLSRDPEGSPQEWENLLESPSLSSSPEFPVETPARRWPELMEEQGMDFYDHQTAFDEREKRELLMQEQDGVLWSV
jgi:hypothetical protein